MPPKKPTSDDLSLWQLAMRDVKRLLGQNDGHEEEPPPAAKKTSKPSVSRPPLQTFTPSFGLKADVIVPRDDSVGLDRRTEDRFRKGQMDIEARLDLHGLTLRDAEPAVHNFVRLQHASGKRCVLIITGKGQNDARERAWYESAKGQIKRQLAHWLDAPHIKPLVLSIAPAKPHHGGGGAFYILLRRQR